MRRASGWFQLRWCRRCTFGATSKAKERRAARARRVFFEPLEDRRVLATITVTSLADNMDVDGQVTLREAIEAANTNTSVDGSEAGGPQGILDEIVFQPGLAGTIDLKGTELVVSSPIGNLQITGPGKDLLTINAHQQSRHFHVTTDISLILEGVTLTGGSVAGNGGAILHDGLFFSAVIVRNSTIRNNSAVNGGGI